MRKSNQKQAKGNPAKQKRGTAKSAESKMNLEDIIIK